MNSFMSTKEFVLGFRKHCSVKKEISELLFGAETKRWGAMESLKFYNQVKKVVIRCGGGDKIFNLRIFVGLIRELRIKLDIYLAGYGPEKLL